MLLVSVCLTGVCLVCFTYGIVDYRTDRVFFFFQQKTAYEMRISDWSSDVCSSDLIVQGTLWQAFDAPEPVVLLIDEIDKADIEFPNDKIGRASGRDRVCQYV